MSSLDHTINSTKKTRWTCISQLTPIEEVELQQVTQNTTGMTLYGNQHEPLLCCRWNWLVLLQRG